MSDSSISDLCVLIVDDNDHMRRLLRSILESLGIRSIRDVENGMVALNESRVNLPDVIITDMMMSPVDGLEFSRMLRDDPTHPATHVPVMMITGFAEKTSCRGCAGCRGHGIPGKACHGGRCGGAIA